MDNNMTLMDIAELQEKRLADMMERSGLMYRLFKRVKSLHSIKHKMEMKGNAYREGKSMMQDMIGFRIVLYFPDDVDAMNIYLSSHRMVKKSEDDLDASTFSPQRLNITRQLPEEYVESFRKCLPEQYADVIDNTYEVQIRTIFSEGWHEVEHDLRYKCKDDWTGCESFSRTLNGVIATLETAEWSMKSLFHEMAYQNYLRGSYRAMLRNKMRLRLVDDDYSAAVTQFLNANSEVARNFLKMDRLVFVLTLLGHKKSLKLTYNHVLFLVNRLEGLSDELRALETPAEQAALDEFLRS